MTTPPGLPLAARAVLAATTSGERQALEAYLDYYRDAVTRKASGAPVSAVAASPVTSGTTIGGLVQHLRVVEDEWFGIFGRPRAEARPAGTGFEFTTSDDLVEALSRYIAAGQRSRLVVARYALDDTAHHVQLGEVSLRWVCLHVLEETARHAGHLDILRELADGTVGV